MYPLNENTSRPQAEWNPDKGRKFLVTEMRVLGVIVDNKLSWSPHVESVNSKVCRKICILQRNKHQLTHFGPRLFYSAVIQQDLEYAADIHCVFFAHYP